jgi:hypothetical protein
MNHPSDDTLLQLALELFDDDENAALHGHLDHCADCRAHYEHIRANMQLLGSIAPDVEAPSLPRQKTRVVRFHPLLKAAALLAVGFFGGFAASAFVNEPPVNVVPSYLVTSLPPDSIARYPVSDATAPSFTLR